MKMKRKLRAFTMGKINFIIHLNINRFASSWRLHNLLLWGAMDQIETNLSEKYFHTS